MASYRLPIVALIVSALVPLCSADPRTPERGASLSLGGRVVHVALAGYGRAGAMHRAAGGALADVADEVRSERGPDVIEWWRPLAGGLEHGVTLATRPAGDGELRLEVMLDGCVARAREDGDLDLVDPDGLASVGRYAALTVIDARGVRHEASMRPSPGGIEIRVDDDGAVYPLVVDPLVTAEEATLVTGGTTGGLSPSISGDGSRTLTLGLPTVHVRSGTNWLVESTLTPTRSGVGGTLARLASDGVRAVLTSSLYEVGAVDGGIAVVFARSGTTWMQEAELTLADGEAGDIFGHAASFSADASRLAISARYDVVGTVARAGSVRTFVRAGTTWAAEATITSPAPAVDDFFGNAVAMSGDGSRLVVGVTGRDPSGRFNAGEVRVLSRSGSTWTSETAFAGSAAMVFCGAAVAIDTTGSRAVYVCDREGMHFVARTGTTWTEEARFALSMASATDVSMSGDGSVVLFGQAHSSGTSNTARLFVRAGTTWAEETGLAVPTPGTGSHNVLVDVSADATRAIVGSPDDDSARVFTLRRTNGVACTVDAACVSGTCVDGVCCATACAGGGSDCQACSLAAGGTTDGTCTALTTVAAPSITCRAAADVCDAPEVCSASSTTCPVDGFLPPSTECRAGVRACDAPESCTGTSAACPTDAPLAAGAVCRPSVGPCDAMDLCNGSSFDCGTDAVAGSGVVCRPIAGLCDAPEACSGSSPVCPTDGFVAVGTACGGAGTCRAAATCDGSSAACPAIGPLRPAGEECAPQLRDPVSGDPLPCDVADVCDGVSEVCMPRWAPAGSACGDATPAGACDAPDACTGTSADCDPAFLSGVECRPSAGACDPPESCLGDDADCPSDVVSPASMVCRASTASCDPAESCDGVAAGCPVDGTSCGATDGGASDTGAPADAGAAPTAAAGCGCRVGRRDALTWLPVLALVGALCRRRVV